MTYYILLPDDNESDTMFEGNVLGETSFKNFWAGQGLTTLMKLVDKQPELLPETRIVKQDGTKLTVERFLTEISKLKIIY